MKKRKIRRRNPVARAVRLIRHKVVPSAKAYSRRLKHKGHSDYNRNDLCVLSLKGYSAASWRLRMRSIISAAAAGMLVPGPYTAETPFSKR
jgi:hypothetical protein